MNNINEFWKDIIGYEGLYQVSNLGNVKSLNYHRTGQEKLLSLRISSHGYLLINLYKDGKYICHSVHRLVAEAFLPNTNNYPEVNHIDKNKLNNNVDNLEWCTRKYNQNHALSKQVAQYDLSGNLIKIWPSAVEIERQLGFFESAISSCCTGYKNCKTMYGYIWKYIN